MKKRVKPGELSPADNCFGFVHKEIVENCAKCINKIDENAKMKPRRHFEQRSGAEFFGKNLANIPKERLDRPPGDFFWIAGQAFPGRLISLLKLTERKKAERFLFGNLTG